jgi:gamma-glutamyltranspeptidase/glutathione hydrolase
MSELDGVRAEERRPRAPASRGLLAPLLGSLLLVAGCDSPTADGRWPAPTPTPASAVARSPVLPRPGAPRSQGLVVSDAPLATQVGVEILESGGNAMDAAVATAFALAVVYPQAGNLGGGGFLVARMHAAGGATGGAASAAGGPGLTEAALDFRETAPAAATPDMFAARPDDTQHGARASGVPGTVAGLYEAHRRFGRLPWNEVVVPAERLALDGFVVDEDYHRALAEDGATLHRWAASIQLLLPDGQPPAVGSHRSFPELAATLRRIAERGADGFYTGDTASLVVAEMGRLGGVITAADLAAYKAIWRDPLAFEYRGHRVLTTPLPSGGLVLAMLCHLLEPYDLRAAGRGSPAELHLLAEALRRAFAARNSYLGDPDAGPGEVPVAMLLSEEWAADQRATISPERASVSDEIVPGPGLPPGGLGADGGPSGHTGHTTHLSVLDRDGNAVSLTTTLNDDFGSGVAVTGAGFLLNDEMDDFTSQPGRPNTFGLVQGAANAIAPGKRMLSSMCPIIVTDADGRLVLVAGAAGGPKIISAVFQVLSNVVDFGLDAPAAVAAPRLHHQHQPDRLLLERAEGAAAADAGGAAGGAPGVADGGASKPVIGFDNATLEALQRLGHRLGHEARLADVIAIGVGPDGRAMVGAPDPRRAGVAGVAGSTAPLKP